MDLAEVEERPRGDAARPDTHPGVIDGCRLPHNLRDTAFVLGYGALEPAVLRYDGRDEHLTAQQLGQLHMQLRDFDRQGAPVRQYNPDHAGVIQATAAARQRAPLARVLDAAHRARLIEHGVRPVPGKPAFRDRGLSALVAIPKDDWCK
jgi:hypothetical protein